MDHEALKDKFIGNFCEWLNSSQLTTEVFVSPKFKCPGDQVIEFLLYKLYDKQEAEVVKFKDYFLLLYNNQVFDKKDIETGFSKFFITIPDIESDFPHLPYLFSDLLYFVFVDEKIADFANVNIDLANCDASDNSDEEPFYMVEIYYKIIGLFMSKIKANYSNKDLNLLYKKFKVSEKLSKLKPYLQNDSIFDELKEDLKLSKDIVNFLNI